MAKKKDAKKKVIVPEVLVFNKGPKIKVNPGQYATDLLKTRHIDDAITFVERLAKPLIGNDQSVINPNYNFWNTVKNTLLNIKNPKRKKKSK